MKNLKLKSTGLIIIFGGILLVSYVLFASKKNNGNKMVPLTRFTATVELSPSGFIPSTLKIKKGTAVTFTNGSDQLYWIASDPHPIHTLLPEFDSQQPIETGGTFTFIFDKVGTFTYHDHLNPLRFNGTVIVEE